VEISDAAAAATAAAGINAAESAACCDWMASDADHTLLVCDWLKMLGSAYSAMQDQIIALIQVAARAVRRDVNCLASNLLAVALISIRCCHDADKNRLRVRFGIGIFQPTCILNINLSVL